MSRFVEKLQQYMEEQGFNPTSLSRQINPNNLNIIADILSGKTKNPRMNTIVSISEVLKVDVNDLLNIPQSRVASANDASSTGVYVPEVSLKAAGADNILDTSNQAGEWLLPKSFLRSHIDPAFFSSVIIVDCNGDSMSPTYNHGDYLLVNTGDTDASAGGVFVVWDGSSVAIRRIRSVSPAEYELICDNSNYPAMRTNKTDTLTKGRVLGRISIL